MTNETRHFHTTGGGHIAAFGFKGNWAIFLLCDKKRTQQQVGVMTSENISAQVASGMWTEVK